MADLETAKSTRSAAKGWVTRCMRNLEAFVLLGAQGNCDVFELEAAIEDFNKRLDVLDEAQYAVEAALPEDVLEQDIANSADYREAAVRVKVKAIRLLSSMRSDSDGSQSGHRSTGSMYQDEYQDVRLPKINLPTFDGKVTEWQSFWERFESGVHQKRLRDVDKFHYLRSVLEGEAKLAIEGFELSSANYEAALSILKERFGRQEAIIFAHIQGLLSIQLDEGGRQSRTSCLRKLLEQLLSHVRSLESLGISGDTYGVVLTPVILSRLPRDITLEWSRTGVNKEGDLSFLLEFLKLEVQRRETADAFKAFTTSSGSATSERKRNQKQFKTPSSSRVPAATALTSSTQKKSRRKCEFCQAPHHTTERCPEYVNLSAYEKQEKLRSFHLCFACLGSTHFSRDCKQRCTTCGRRHHVSLCTSGQPKPGKPVYVEQPAASGVKDVHVSVNHQNSNVCSAFKTANVKVVGQRGSVNVTLLFDGGSDHTFVTNDLVKKIGSKWVENCTVGFAPFGGGKSHGNRSVYELQCLGNDGNVISFSAISVPVITLPIKRHPVPKDIMQKVQRLNTYLADDITRTENITVDILVGLDMYWSLVDTDCTRLTDNIVMQNTVFGHVVSGSWLNGSQQVSNNVSHSVNVHALFTLANFQLEGSGVTDQSMRRLWDVEVIGIKPTECSETDTCLDEFNCTVSFVDGRYEVALP